MYGNNTLSGDSFCKRINLARAKIKLLSCANLEIRSLDYYTDVEDKMITWMKNNMVLPANRFWWSMASAHNWLKYNFASDLYIIHLSLAHTHYYMCVRDEYLRYFRMQAYGTMAAPKN